MKHDTEKTAGLLHRARRSIKDRDWEAARGLLETLLGSGPQTAETYNDYGRVLNNLGDLNGAAQAFASAVKLAPDFAEAFNNLGHVLRTRGEYERAEKNFARAVQLQPEYARAHFNRASALNLLGRNADAVACLRTGLRYAPDDAMAHCNLATLYRSLDQYEGARRHFEEAIRLQPGLTEAHVGLAGLQVNLGEIEAALANYESVLATDPKNVDARVGIADIMDLQGAREEALVILSTGDSDDPGVAVARANLQRNSGQHDRALQTLLDLQQRDPTACAQMPRFYYVLGDVYDRLGRYDEAMENFVHANSMHTAKFDRYELESAIDALLDVFSPAWIANAPDSGNQSDRPVFIIGMPRSGTSLVEQILASHPRVYGAGELNIVVDMVRRLGRESAATGGYPRCVRQLDTAALSALAKSHLQALNKLDDTADRVTDKLPHNFLHLGLIRLLFPNCRIIHCTRDFRDTALSCFFQNFSTASMAFTNSLDDIGAYYSEYLRLMAHWQDTLGLTIQEASYEQLVADQESVSRKLIAFLGLDWDPACLRFHESRRFVNTASYAQVVKPIYASSVGRHKNYAKYLGPLTAATGEPP